MIRAGWNSIDLESSSVQNSSSLLSRKKIEWRTRARFHEGGVEGPCLEKARIMTVTTHLSCSHAVNEQAFVDQPLCRKTSFEFATCFLSDVRVLARRCYLTTSMKVIINIISKIM